MNPPYLIYKCRLCSMNFLVESKAMYNASAILDIAFQGDREIISHDPCQNEEKLSGVADLVGARAK